MNDLENKTEVLWTRCTPTLKRRLQEYAAKSIAPDMSDHIRFALQEYLNTHAPEPESVPAQPVQ